MDAITNGVCEAYAKAQEFLRWRKGGCHLKVYSLLRMQLALMLNHSIQHNNQSVTTLIL